MRLVTVTPAGRRRCLEVLANYLLRNRDQISEHRWWLNTRNGKDLTYLFRLVDRHPDFFRVVAKPVGPADRVGHTIWQYMKDCRENDTVYLRLDDDICYVSHDAIRQMYEQRLSDPNPLLVLGNIVNNAVCTHFHQLAGRAPRSWGEVRQQCLDPLGWADGRFAARLHKRFLRDLSQDAESRWKETPFGFDGLSRFSINAVCWRGEDFQLIDDAHGDSDVEEESFLTAVAPQRLGRPNAICAKALFAHYAFFTQRAYLDAAAPEVLARYLRFSQHAVTNEAYRLPLIDHTRIIVKRTWGTFALKARQALKRKQSSRPPASRLINPPVRPEAPDTTESHAA